MRTSDSLVLPNLILIGPPKCGTSSLFRWLTAHPKVCGSLRKETFFLMDEENPLCASNGYTEKGLQGYARFFPDNAADYPVRLEATPHYFYQRTAQHVLAEMPECRVCVVLREPAARVLSSFEFTKNNLAYIPKQVTFEEYVDRVLAGESIYPDLCINRSSAYVLERDIQIGHYARILNEWIRLLGHDRVHWALFDDLKTRPRETVGQLLAPFEISLDDYEQYDFPRHNETYRVKYQRLHRTVRWANRLIQWNSKSKTFLKRGYLRLQNKNYDGMRMKKSSSGLRRLRKYYRPYNEELEQLLSVNLSDWSTV